MDSEASSTKRSRSKRRDRPAHAAKEKHTNHVVEPPANLVGPGEESMDNPPIPARTAKEKGKGKARKPKRGVSPTMIEDIIDGFAIASFKTLEDLEATVKSIKEKQQHEQQEHQLQQQQTVPLLPQQQVVSMLPQQQAVSTLPPSSRPVPTLPTATHTVTQSITSSMSHPNSPTAMALLPPTTVPQAVPLQVTAPTVTVGVVVTSSHSPSSSSITSIANASINSNCNSVSNFMDIEQVRECPVSSQPRSPVPKVKDKVKKETPKKPKKEKMQSASSAIKRTPTFSPSCINNNVNKADSEKHPIVPAVVKVEETQHQQNGTTSTISDRSSSRDRLSDVSTHSSSGRGYLCDIESGDDRASDAESEPLFTPAHTKAVSSTSLCLPVALPAADSVTSTTTTTTSTCVISSNCTTITNPTTSVVPISTTAPPAARCSQTPPSVRLLPHPQVQREVPKPIPGLSGTRLDDTKKSHNPGSISKSQAWSSSASANPAPYSSPHISPPSQSLSLSLHTTRHTPTPSLHQHPLPPPLTPHHPVPPPPAHHHHPHNMFAPPLAPPHPPLTSTALPVPGSMHAPFGSDSIASYQQSQELIRRELDRHFLDRLHQDRLPAPPASAIPPYIHQHQHQHMHQHQHTHYGASYPPSLQGSLLPPTATHLVSAKFDKTPKIDSPFYRPNVPGLPAAYQGLSPLLHPSGPSAHHLSSSIHGAFQPKNLSAIPTSMHHTQLLINLRDREKSASLSGGPGSLPVIKSGKWCAMHVRVAWEIFHHQQKQQAEAQKNPDGTKPGDPLRPPSHLLPGGSSLHRAAGDLGGSPSIFGSPHSRSSMEGGGAPPPGSFLNPSHLGVPPFPRPAPYGGLGSSLGSPFGGLGGGMLAGREVPGMPGLTSPHEWNRLHRTPPSFPTPPAWPKADAEREREKEREREREKERDREHREKEREKREDSRDREKERQRERDAERDREREKAVDRDREPHARPRNSPVQDVHSNGLPEERIPGKHQSDRHRSRSRSPVRNGPVDDQRDSSSRDSAFKNDIKIKEERKDELLNDSLMKEKRNDVMRNDMRNDMRMDMRNDMLNSHSSLLPANSHMLLERSRAISQLPGYSGLDRPHHGLWAPFDRGLDLTHHSLELRREMERERERMLQRFPNPASIGVMLEHERFREQEMQLRDRVSMEARLALDRERAMADHERSKLPVLRHSDPIHPRSSLYPPPRGASPSVNHNHTSSSSKSTSPTANPTGVPPPLIPSNSALGSSRSHPSSPNITKGRSSSPVASVTGPASEVTPKEATANGSDTDAQSR